MSTKIVNGVEYISEDIPGLGVCLVPIPRNDNKAKVREWFQSLTISNGSYLLHDSSLYPFSQYIIKTGDNSFHVLWIGRNERKPNFNGGGNYKTWINLTLDQVVDALCNYHRGIVSYNHL